MAAPPAPPTSSYPSPYPHNLTKSQKKRLRKQRSKLGTANPAPQTNGGYPPMALAPQPAPLQQQTNGVYPTPGLETASSTCTHEIMARHPRGHLIRCVCSLNPSPHIGQPHTMRLHTENPQDSAYVIWWGAGE